MHRRARPEFPVIEDRRFWKFRLHELFTLYSYQVLEFCKGLRRPEEVANKVIRDVRYPFHLGEPDDTHLFNAFHGGYRFCVKVKEDFWQTADETARIRTGDCEDSSILFVACCGSPEIKLRPRDVYEAFGVVRDADTGRILGGHGWSYYRRNREWHLIESTLDEPPTAYPVVDNIKRPFRIGRAVYEPWVLFNWADYMELEGLERYKKLRRRERETEEKYRAIEAAWKITTKPLTTLRRMRFLRLRRAIGRLLRKW